MIAGPGSLQIGCNSFVAVHKQVARITVAGKKVIHISLQAVQIGYILQSKAAGTGFDHPRRQGNPTTGCIRTANFDCS